jgi:hypothetical protein
LKWASVAENGKQTAMKNISTVCKAKVCKANCLFLRLFELVASPAVELLKFTHS